jgi:hypothetical protein
MPQDKAAGGKASIKMGTRPELERVEREFADIVARAIQEVFSGAN